VSLFEVCPRTHGSTSVLTLSGELDLSVAAQLRSELIAQIHATGPGRLILLFDNVTFLDCACVGALIHAFQHGERLGVTLCLACLRGTPRRLADLIELDQLIPVYETLERALAE
jgi:anti-anti-sigma factor